MLLTTNWTSYYLKNHLKYDEHIAIVTVLYFISTRDKVHRKHGLWTDYTYLEGCLEVSLKVFRNYRGSFSWRMDRTLHKITTVKFSLTLLEESLHGLVQYSDLNCNYFFLFFLVAFLPVVVSAGVVWWPMVVSLMPCWFAKRLTTLAAYWTFKASVVCVL